MKNKKAAVILVQLEEQDLLEKIRLIIRSELEKITTALDNTVVHEVPGLTQKPLYKAKEVCSMLHISRQTLYQWVKEGLIKSHKVKSRLFFLKNDLDRLMGTPVNG